jgi:hypothetical protein
MFDTLCRCPRTIARHENGPLNESRRRYLEHLAAQGAAFHTIRAAAGVIYPATIMMKLDESSPVERRDVERAAKQWASKPTRSFDKPHATGSDSPAGYENQIGFQIQISRSSMPWVATWTQSGDFRRQRSQRSNLT